MSPSDLCYSGTLGMDVGKGERGLTLRSRGAAR
jgi:hypothetical protein